MINYKSPKSDLGLLIFKTMRMDIIELRWGLFEPFLNRKKEELLVLVRYKDKNESLQEFLEASQRYSLVLEYYINNMAYSEYMQTFRGMRYLEEHYANHLSYSIGSKSDDFNKNHAWRKIVLKKLLLEPITIEDIELCYPHLKKTPELLQEEFEKEQKDWVFIYGCPCLDKMCGGEVVTVDSTENTVSWDINIRYHRKFVFDKKQYLDAFEEIKAYIFKGQ